MKMGAGMTKKQAPKNVIPRLDRGIQGVFNLNTKDTKLVIPLYPPLEKGGEEGFEVFSGESPCNRDFDNAWWCSYYG